MEVQDLWAKGMQASCKIWRFRLGDKTHLLVESRIFDRAPLGRISVGIYVCYEYIISTIYRFDDPFPTHSNNPCGMVAGLCGPLGLCQCFTSGRLGAAVGTLRRDLGTIAAAGFDACGAGTGTHMATVTEWHLWCRWAQLEVATKGWCKGHLELVHVNVHMFVSLDSFGHLFTFWWLGINKWVVQRLWGWILGSQPWASMRPPKPKLFVNDWWVSLC